MNRIIALGAAGLLGLSGLGTAAATTSPAASRPANTAGHARALKEVKALLAEAPTLAGATAVSTSPVKRLDGPPDLTSITTNVVRASYWTVNESAKQAYKDLIATVPAGLENGGSGTSGGPGANDTIYSSSDFPTELPAGLYSAELDIAVTPTSTTTSAIGVYGQAVPVPPKPRDETIPASVHRAHVELDHANGKVTRARTVSGSLAASVIAAFNALTVDPPNDIRPCPARPTSAPTEVLTFHIGSDVVVATPGICNWVDVVRNGRRLKTLDDSSAFEKAFRAALAPRAADGFGRHPKRPAREHIPGSVHSARVAHRDGPFAKPTKHHTVAGAAARALIRAFNHLPTEPTNYFHCDIAGGPTDIVTFGTAHHTWTVTESACTDVLVTRDGHDLPTLLADPAWSRALDNALA